jgi:hypothetical protein
VQVAETAKKRREEEKNEDKRKRWLNPCVREKDSEWG